MSDAVIRLTGRPKIDRDTSGLRRITRTYIVQGSAVTEGNVEDQVFLPYGTPDIEYHDAIRQDLSNGGLTNDEVTGAYLVEQSIAPGQSIGEATLTRVYQELDGSNEPVQMGGEKIVRGAQDRLTVTKTFIVKNPHTAHYSGGRIGIDNVVVAGSTCYLGTVQSEKTEVYTQFVEVYFEDGVLSESVNYKYGQYPNHRLETRTLRSVVDIPPPPNTEGPGNGPWFRVDEKEGPGNQDFGQLGKTVKTVIFAKGEGLISEDAEVKGKPPNTVEVTTIKYITGENGAVPAANIPNFTRRTFEGKEEKDGWELHTIRGVVVNTDNGVVDVDVQYKHGEKPNHKLEIAKAISYGVAPTAANVLSFVYPGGDNSNLGPYVLVTERENTTGEYDVYTSTFARGNGTISETEKKVGFAIVTETVSLHPPSPALPITIQAGELTRKVELLDGYQKLTVSTTTEDSGLVEDKTDTKNNGALVVKTLMQLGTVWDATNTPADFVEISIRKHRYDIYPAITKVFARGSGQISLTKRKEGLATIVETVTLFKADVAVSTTLGANELRRTVEEKDGYKILSITTTDQALTLIDNSEEEFHNGALSVISRTSLGSVWNASNTPAGYVEVSHRDHTYKEYAAVTKKFAKGEGSIQVGEREEGLFTIQSHIVLGNNPTLPNRAVNITTTEEQGYVKTKYEIKIANITKEDFKSSYGSGIVTTTKSKLNHNYPQLDAAGGRSIKWLDGENYLGVGIDIEPTKLKEVSKSYGGGIKKVSTTEISKSDANSFADGGSVIQIAADVFRNTKIEIDTAHLSSEETSYGSGIVTVRKTTIDSTAQPLGNSGGSSEQIGNVIYKNSTKEVAAAIYQDQNISFGGGVKRVTQTTINNAAGNLGNSGGRIEQLASDVFRNSTTDVQASIYEDKNISYSSGVKRVTETSIGARGQIGNSGGKIEQLADDIFRNTRVVISPSIYTDRTISFSGGVKRTTETQISPIQGQVGNSGGRIEQLADDIFRNTTVDIAQSIYEDKTINYSGGVKRVQETKISDTQGTIGNSGGRIEQLADDIFKNSTVEISASIYEDKNISYSRGVKRTTETKIETSQGTLGNTGGRIEQIADDIFRNSTVTIQSASYADVDVSYSTGFTRTKTTTIDNAFSQPDSTVGGLSEQLADDIFRNQTIVESSSTYEQKDINHSKWYKLISERSVSGSSTTPDDKLGGTTSQIASALFLNTELTIEESDKADEVVDFIGAGAVKVTKTTEVGGGTGSLESSSVHVHPEIGAVETRTEYEIGELEGESVTLENGINKVTTTTSVSQDATMGGEFGSATQIAKGFFRKQTKEYELWSELDGKVISDRTYYRLGVEFNEVQQWGSSPSVSGTTVQEKEEKIIVPQGSGSTTITKYTKLGATFKSKSWTTYEVRNFSCPGVIDISKDGIVVQEPKTVPLWCKITHTLVQTPGSNSGSYVQPTATLDMVVGFKDRVKDYSIQAGGGNYVLKGNKAVPQEDDKFMGSTVLFCNQEKDGQRYNSWSPQNKVFTSSTDLIYTADNFDVFHQQEVSANAKPVL